MTMHKGYLRTAFILGAITVAMGAFGAHGLEGKVADKAVKTFETAVRYQFYHVIALAFCGLLYREFPNRWTRMSGLFFLAGMILFCGSLYVLTFSLATVSPSFKWVGPVTPFGGLLFIIGWICLALGTRQPTLR
jgi:uncharacterized membrane protein YgdD (TMEM256/DUF423 family)